MFGFKASNSALLTVFAQLVAVLLVLNYNKQGLSTHLRITCLREENVQEETVGSNMLCCEPQRRRHSCYHMWHLLYDKISYLGYWLSETCCY